MKQPTINRDNGPDGATGCEAAIEVFRRTHNAFPDIKVTIRDLIEEDNKVTFRGRFRALTKPWVK